MTIEAFTHANLRGFNAEVREALDAIAQKHGLTLKAHTPRFDSTKATVRYSFETQTESGMPHNFAMHASILGLSEDCFHAEFESNGSIFRIVDIVPRRRKYPVLAEKMKNDKPTGSLYKFTCSYIKLHAVKL